MIRVPPKHVKGRAATEAKQPLRSGKTKTPNGVLIVVTEFK